MSYTINQIIAKESVETLMQLVISPNRDFTAGIEALSRGIDYNNGQHISPLTLFENAKAEGQLIELEKLLIRKALKTFEPIHAEHKDLLLFINLSDPFIEYELTNPFLIEITQLHNICFGNVVFDINPLTEPAMAIAKTFIEKYKALGFYMCIDDIGVGYNNIDKTLYLNPDMIKINMGIGRKLANIQYWNNLVRFIKYIADQQGILLVAKGIENETDVHLSIENGTQYMQGYFISKPVNLEKVSLTNIIEGYRESMKTLYTESGEEMETTRVITARLISITKDIRFALGNKHFEEIKHDSEAFFELYPFIENIWLLDSHGHEIGDTVINTQKYAVKSSPMFQIYNEGSDFSSKEIYRQLTDTILDVWVTRPYRSILTNNIVIGCSLYAQENSEDIILCVNFNYSGILEHLNKHK